VQCVSPVCNGRQAPNEHPSHGLAGQPAPYGTYGIGVEWSGVECRPSLLFRVPEFQIVLAPGPVRAPVLPKIPLVGNYRSIGTRLNRIGLNWVHTLTVHTIPYRTEPARSKTIVGTLTNQDRTIGIILDGIEGMFNNANANANAANANSDNDNDNDTETGAVRNRKGIVQIGLPSRPMPCHAVPCGHRSLYGFGHARIFRCDAMKCDAMNQYFL